MVHFQKLFNDIKFDKPIGVSYYIMSSLNGIIPPPQTWMGIDLFIWVFTSSILTGICTILTIVFICLTAHEYSAVKLALIFVFLICAVVFGICYYRFDNAHKKELHLLNPTDFKSYHPNQFKKFQKAEKEQASVNQV